MARIVIAHIGLGGHLRPLSRLGAALARHGHEVIALAPEEHRSPVEVDGVRLEPHEPMPMSEIYGGLAGFTANLARATERCSQALIEQLFELDVDLVVHDSHAPWGKVAADFLGIPRIVSDPLFPVRNAQAAAVRVRSGGAVEVPKEALEIDPRARFYPGGFEGALARVQESRDAIAKRWGVDLGGWLTVTRCTGPVTVCYTTEEILGDLMPERGWWCLGPLMAPVPRDVSPRERSVVYVALGTFFNHDPAVFRAAIDALAEEAVDVVVSTGRGSVSPSALEPIPPNVSVHDFVDSRAVLAAADVHITHGGGSSVHESLLAGVPMLCIPQGSDQYMWAQRASAAGAAEEVAPEPGAIRAAVRRLLADPEPRARAQALGAHLAALDGEGRLAALVAQLLGQELGPRGVSSSSASGASSLPSATGTS